MILQEITKYRKTERKGATFYEKYEGARTNKYINVPTIRCLDCEPLSLTRETRHGVSRPDPLGTRVSRVNRNATGRVGSGQEVLETSRVGRIGSTSFQISRVGSGRVGSRGLQNLVGQVGSGREISKLSQVGSGQVTRPDPTKPVRCDVTREKPWIM